VAAAVGEFYSVRAYEELTWSMMIAVVVVVVVVVRAAVAEQPAVELADAVLFAGADETSRPMRRRD
jgi:hypothetical protein